MAYIYPKRILLPDKSLYFKFKATSSDKRHAHGKHQRTPTICHRFPDGAGGKM